MADVIEFPIDVDDLEAFPEPHDEYRAAASPARETFAYLGLVFPDGSIRSYRFIDIKRMEFSPAACSPDGLDVLHFGIALRAANKLTDARIEGRNLLDLYNHVGQHRTRWLRVLPAGQHVRNPATPVITKIALSDDDV